MAKPRGPRRSLDSYTIKPSNKTITAGDCVLMRPSDPSKPSYVARIEGIESDSRGGNVKVRVRWYYRPEESIGGRRQFHGAKELFLSDHYDLQSADTIEAKCNVHSFKTYTKLESVGSEDFFCRFEYNSSTGSFNPDRVAVFHPACINMTPEEAKKIEHFFCHNCASEDHKKLQDSHNSKHSDMKVDTKRRRR